VSATQLSITLSAVDQATAGTYPVVVTNPAPGGGTSNALNFTATNSIVNLSVSNLNFGNQLLQTTSTAQTVTLNNSGNTLLNVTSVAVTGANAGDFSETDTCGSPVAAGSYCTIAVLFTPSITGSRTASISITDNAAGSPQMVSLNGTGTAPVVSISPTSMTFGSQTVGAPSAPETVTVNNTGNSALSITSITITGANASDFSETDTCGTSVAAGGNCTMSLTFTPSASGIRTASVTITDNASGSPQTVSLSGNGSGAGGFVLPVKASSNNRYLVDQNNQPWLLMGDAAWEMMGLIGPSDMAVYMSDRQARGFNATLITFPCAFGQCPANGSALDGTLPFTSGSDPSNFDLSTPNSAYWSEVDAVVNLAASNGLVVLFDPTELYGFMQTFRNNGPTKCYNYGVYLGNRYKNFPNILWHHGNDFQTWNTSSTDNNLIYQVMLGIASVDANHLQTIELNYNFSYGNQDTLLNGVLTMDSAYTYSGIYDEVLQAYKSTPTLPTFLIEANYEGENDTGGLPGPAGPYVLREQAYWTLTSGGVGQIWGNKDIYPFDSYWKTSLDSPGALQIAGINSFFASYPWWNLVPDCTTNCNIGSNHSVVTAGFGTYDGSSLDLAQNNYCSTGWLTNGSLAIIYCPGNTNPPSAVTITVNMGVFSGPMRARWFDPSNGPMGGTYTAISGSPFVNSGTQNFTTPGTNGANSAGDQDWVLVLDQPAQ
jgi:hypothetical protein